MQVQGDRKPFAPQGPGEALPALRCCLVLDGVEGPRWWQASHGACTAYARGAAFWNGWWYSESQLAQLIARTAGGAAAQGKAASQVLAAMLPELNGFWACYVELANGEAIAAVDRLRSIPLFYCTRPDGCLQFAPEVRLTWQPAKEPGTRAEAELEFLLGGLVTGQDTLRAGVHQLEPGEMVCCEAGRLHRKRYYRFCSENIRFEGQETLQRELGERLHAVFSRLVGVLAGRRVVVPLSGGVDSRLIAGLLKYHGHDNLVALGYGRPDNPESQVARQVAEALEIPWVFVPYEQGRWYELLSSPDGERLSAYAGQQASLPHLQDYQAVHQQWSPQRSASGERVVIVPGIEAMITGQAHPARPYPEPPACNLRRLVRRVMDSRFDFWPVRRRLRKTIEQRLRAYFASAPSCSKYDEESTACEATSFWSKTGGCRCVIMS